MTVTIYKDEAANAIFVQDNNGAQFMNNLQVVMDDPSDTSLHIRDKSKDNYLFYAVPHDSVVDQAGNGYGVTALLACNALNALFSAAGGSDGVAPVITSSTSIALTAGDTLNYELVATGGVGYEWSNLPSGVTTVEGNVRKLIGGSGLSEGTYNITAKAINYFGEASETISLVVSSSPFSDTKSIKFVSGDYLGANASLLDGELGRSGNGSGASDAWTVSWWFKAPTHSNNNQTMFYFGDNDAANGGRIRMRFAGSLNSMRFQYGSDNNNISWASANDVLPSEQWKHVMMTYDGGTTGSSSGSLSNYYSRFRFFIDGSEVTSNGTFSQNNYGYTGGIDPDNLRIGREITGDSLKPNSYVDEVSVWDSDQSANISDIYNGGATHDLTLLNSAPAHYWHMGDEDTYPTLQDNVGSAHFVMYNMTAADIVTDAP